MTPGKIARKMTMEVNGKKIKIQGRAIRIARLEAEKYEFLDTPELALDVLKKCGVRIDLFTFLQRVADTIPKYSYAIEQDNFAVLRISTFDAWWTGQIDNKTRNMVRKGEKKGLVIRETAFDESLVRGIWEIYNECRVRQGKPFPHFGKDIETVHSEEGTFLDRSIFIGAYLEDRLVGFIKLVVDETQTQAGILNLVSLVQHRDKAPNNALLSQAVRSCADRGIPHLVYSNFAYGKRQRDSLSDFKKNNGFEQVEVPRYYVPLTALGWIALRLGMHRRFVDRLPESVITKYREYRNAWYSRKLQSTAQSN
jgi:hypothetical protein